MSVIAGAISRNDRALPDSLRDSLTTNLSRHRGDVPDILSGSGWLLAHVDVGALQCSGTFTATDGSALIIAGEPLLSGPQYEACRNREDEGRILFQDFRYRSSAALLASTGAFCGAYYSPSRHRLTLITDKLGLRPIYYIVTSEFAAFTSALRVFEAAGLTGGAMDLEGTYQTCVFGFPLGTRTCYTRIRTLGPAECLEVTKESESHVRYFRWDRLERSDRDEDQLIGRLGDAFKGAVARRLRRDKTVLAFLSGGLDSRAIAATLRAGNVNTFTINFAPPRTQDRVFGALAATALGTQHRQLEIPHSSAKDAYRQEFLERWVAFTETAKQKPERPRCIWSGDGGSCGFGHIYLDDKMVDCLDAGDTEGGIREFLRYNRIHGAANNAMTRAFQERSMQWHVEGIREELAALDQTSPGRAIYLFLMLNDQRRHMAAHFENIDRHRFEFHMPFFDSDFIEVIVRAPIRPFLHHALYHQWLKALSPLAASVPWQTYPNHLPCPVPFNEQLRYQWIDYVETSEDRRLARIQGRQALLGLFSRRFPGHLIHRFRYAAAVATSLMGSTSYLHIVEVGETFVRYWQRTNAVATPSFAFPPRLIKRTSQ